MSKFDQIINSWKEEIESISINGFNRKIESVDFFPMKSKHHPDNPFFWTSDAWKVNFNFMDGIRGYDTKPPISHDDWGIELNRLFKNKFGDISFDVGNGTEFNNSKCEYMTYQGHRFIIQFYPDAFIEEIRNEKLEKLGI